MPTPLYSLRLPEDVQLKLVEVGRLCGYENGRAFARDLIEVTLTDDRERFRQFWALMRQRVGVQQVFDWDEVHEADKPAQKPRKQAVKGKGDPRHAKRA